MTFVCLLKPVLEVMVPRMAEHFSSLGFDADSTSELLFYLPNPADKTSNKGDATLKGTSVPILKLESIFKIFI